MDGWLPVLAFIPGFFAGWLFTSFTIHWVALLMSGWRRSSLDAQTPSTSGRVLARIFSIVHPVPWLLLVGIPYGIHRLIATPPSRGWQWFFGGVAAAIVVMILVSFIAVRRHRAKAADKGVSNAGPQNVA